MATSRNNLIDSSESIANPAIPHFSGLLVFPGRQTGRHAGRQTGRQADKQTGRQAGIHAGRVLLLSLAFLAFLLFSLAFSCFLLLSLAVLLLF